MKLNEGKFRIGFEVVDILLITDISMQVQFNNKYSFQYCSSLQGKEHIVVLFLTENGYCCVVFR